MGRAYISIGSNIEGPVAQVRRAIEHLRAFGEIVAVSQLYRGKPWGGIKSQPDFVNSVVLLDTTYSPQELLLILKRAEQELGRVASQRWGPRSIDFDILTYDDLKIDDADFVIPHPHMRERAFVLVPLAEIDPAYVSMRDALPAGELESVHPIVGE